MLVDVQFITAATWYLYLTKKTLRQRKRSSSSTDESDCDKSYLTKRLDLYLDKKTLVTHIRPSKYLT